MRRTLLAVSHRRHRGAGTRQAAPPATDIFLAPISMQNGRPVIGTPVNITNRPGYDNQPSFTPDSRSILYTSTREDAQSDIYRYDIASKQITRVTTTPESEYSATVMPGGKRFSVIRVEKDSTQRLWSFALDGSDPKVVIETLKPVGYHAWIDANNLALFVLGSPNALVHTDIRTGNRIRWLEESDDRCSRCRTRRDSRSCDRRIRRRRWSPRAGRASRRRICRATATDTGRRVALEATSRSSGSGSTLLFWTKGASTWVPVADLAPAGIHSITRLAVSPDGRWLAIVAEPDQVAEVSGDSKGSRPALP